MTAADAGENAPSRLLNPATRSPSQATEGGWSRFTSSRLCPDSAGWTVSEQHWRRVRVVLRPASLGRNLRPGRLEPPAGDLWSGGSGSLVDDRIVRWPGLWVGDRPCRSLGVPLLVAGHHLGALGVSSSVQGQNSIVWISPEVIRTSFYNEVEDKRLDDKLKNSSGDFAANVAGARSGPRITVADEACLQYPRPTTRRAPPARVSW